MTIILDAITHFFAFMFGVVFDHFKKDALKRVTALVERNKKTAVVLAVVAIGALSFSYWKVSKLVAIQAANELQKHDDNLTSQIAKDLKADRNQDVSKAVAAALEVSFKNCEKEKANLMASRPEENKAMKLPKLKVEENP